MLSDKVEAVFKLVDVTHMEGNKNGRDWEFINFKFSDGTESFTIPGHLDEIKTNAALYEKIKNKGFKRHDVVKVALRFGEDRGKTEVTVIDISHYVGAKK